MRVTVRCFPKEDMAFAARVAGRVRHVHTNDVRGLADALSLLVPGLRIAYPRVRLVVQEPLASDGTDRIVVYAYRDGHALRIPREAPGAMAARTRLEADMDVAAALAIQAEGLLAGARSAARAFVAARSAHVALAARLAA